MATRSSAADGEAARALRVNDRLAIPRAELGVRATRASGAGGQHVNKTSTRVEITWNVSSSQALSDEDRARLITRLASRLSDDGELRVVASDTRSQLQNRDLAETRLADMVRRALVIPRVRRKTRPSRAAKQARLDDKRKLSEKKRVRRSNTDD
ncbi:MAG TPA: alternative ribosome rescue aminoacyl-tRNA hydrolase ArfB [Gemmatimonadaceae bacterium]|nr:alternative ribosome rescue aminoacyl-tRNA hydrolase ArfB [Gemmatimonadaceae bacterium]